MRRFRHRSPASIIVGLLIAAIAAIYGATRPNHSAQLPAPSAPAIPAPPLLKPSETTPRLLPPGAEPVTVKRAVDGDTVELSDGRRVRYLGIDTPEHNEPFFEEAKQFNARLVEGKPAWLEFDIEKTDRYDRLLAFVWVKDGDDARLVNAEILRAGLARVYTPGPNAKHKDALLACQREARESQRGSWANYVLGGATGSFLTTRNGHAFHKKDCETLKDANAATLKTWTSRDAMMDAGFSPCRTCKP
jgi:micrococcal nuclease